MGVKEILVHSDFNPSTYVNDIAIVVLNKNVDMKGTVNGACAPRRDEKFDSCFVTGWGRLREAGAQSTFLQKLQVDILFFFRKKYTRGKEIKIKIYGN